MEIFCTIERGGLYQLLVWLKRAGEVFVRGFVLNQVGIHGIINTGATSSLAGVTIGI
jgi:hypothetical protein